MIPGGTEDLEHLPLPGFRYGFVGCISDFSVGQLYNLNLIHDAKNGQNVERCERDNFDDQEDDSNNNPIDAV